MRILTVYHLPVSIMFVPIVTTQLQENSVEVLLAQGMINVPLTPVSMAFA